jgi:type II secretory pathway pseudopilin PulG
MRLIAKNNRGESLLETIIAFIVLGIGVTIAGMILGSSLRNMQNSKNRVIAVNIAREGIEAVRNIRDTNWLQFHSKRRACWNNAPAQNPATPCDGTTPIKPGKYIIYKQGGYPTHNSSPTYRWLFGELTWNGITKSDTPPLCDSDIYYYNNIDGFTYRCNIITKTWTNVSILSLVDIDPTVDTDGDHNFTDDEDMYNHLYQRESDALGTWVKDSFFSRVITIEYIDNQGNIITNESGYNANINRMQVTSTVSWLSGNNRFKVVLTTHLTDYLGREKLDG